MKLKLADFKTGRRPVFQTVSSFAFFFLPEKNSNNINKPEAWLFQQRASFFCLNP